MAVKKQKTVPKANKKPARSSKDRAFEEALKALESMAKDRLLNASDPFKTGIKIAEQIRGLAERVENEVRAESMSLTEAGYASDDAIGAGIGVF